MDYKPTLICLCGLPRTGKTTYAEEVAYSYDAEVISSDLIREELFGNANDQSHNPEVFDEMYRRTKEALGKGINVIYDATNLSHKRRVNLIKMTPNAIHECHIITATLADCIQRDSKSQRKVGRDVITRMAGRFEVPYMEEGWDRIELIRRDNVSYDLELLFKQHYEMNQKTHWHDFTLGEHCEKVEHAIEQFDFDGKDVAVAAARYHDIGKPYCQTFGDNGQAHYYGHNNIGAWIALSSTYTLNTNRQALLDLAFYICYHMYEFSWGKKAEQRLNELTPEHKFWLTTLASCDKANQRLNKEEVAQ